MRATVLRSAGLASGVKPRRRKSGEVSGYDQDLADPRLRTRDPITSGKNEPAVQDVLSGAAQTDVPDDSETPYADPVSSMNPETPITA